MLYIKLSNNNHLFIWITDLYLQSNYSKCFEKTLTDRYNSRQNHGQPYPWVGRIFLFVDVSSGSWSSVLLNLCYHWRYPFLSFRISLLLMTDLEGFLGSEIILLEIILSYGTLLLQGYSCLLTNLKKKKTQTQKQTMTTDWEQGLLWLIYCAP